MIMVKIEKVRMQNNFLPHSKMGEFEVYHEFSHWNGREFIDRPTAAIEIFKEWQEKGMPNWRNKYGEKCYALVIFSYDVGCEHDGEWATGIIIDRALKGNFGNL